MTGRRKTGDCYEAAARRVVFEDHPGEIVHGTVTGTGPNTLGVRYGHAWIEVGETVHDYSNGKALDPVVMPRDLYYLLGSIDSDETRRYTKRAAQKAIGKTGHWGPWAPVIGAEV